MEIIQWHKRDLLICRNKSDLISLLMIYTHTGELNDYDTRSHRLSEILKYEKHSMVLGQPRNMSNRFPDSSSHQGGGSLHQV